MDERDDSAGIGTEHQACALARKLCSCGSFEEGGFRFHPPGAPGDHPAVCATCGQEENLDWGCCCRAALAKLKKQSDLLRVQHLHSLKSYLKQINNFCSPMSIWGLRRWWLETIFITDTNRHTAYPAVLPGAEGNMELVMNFPPLHDEKRSCAREI